MSTHYEGVDVTHPFFHIEVVPAGTEIGEDEITDPAVVLHYDEVVYITGPLGKLEKALTEALEKVRALVCPDCNDSRAVPASGGEDPADVDNGYVRCPTCKDRT